MTTSRRLQFQCLVLVSASLGQSVVCGAERVDDDGRLTLRGTVLTADGSPAANAEVVHSGDRKDSDAQARTTRTDEQGRFVLRDSFFLGASLHARSDNGEQQATLGIKAEDVRTRSKLPIELRLSPARSLAVKIVSKLGPVKGARVVADGDGFRMHAETGSDGFATMRVPSDVRLTDLIALHPELGVAGMRDYRGINVAEAELQLREPSPHTVRVVDEFGKPIAGVPLNISFRPFETRQGDLHWIQASDALLTKPRTDVDGRVVIPWMPREKVWLLGVAVLDAHWLEVGTKPNEFAPGVTTLHVLRTQTVEGRLVFPHGVRADGLLVAGFGFGPESLGNRPSARVRADGSFTLRVAPTWGYVLNVCDAELAGSGWSGNLLPTGGEPAKPEIAVYPAIPLDVRVVRGPDKTPVKDAHVAVSERLEVALRDERGRKHSGVAGNEFRARTDANGMARFPVGRGLFEIRLTSGDWSEERKITVDSLAPRTVEFERVWLGKRQLAGTLTNDGQRHVPSNSAVIDAWIPTQYGDTSTVRLAPKSDGSFELALDAPAMHVLAVDWEQRLGGFAKIGSGDVGLDLKLSAMARYGGQLLNTAGEPLAGRTLSLFVERDKYLAAKDVVTDDEGRFLFPSVVSNVPLQLGLVETMKGNRVRHLEKRFFEPAEVRENTRVVFTSDDDRPTTTQPKRTLQKVVEQVVRDARLNHLHALFVIRGDESKATAELERRVLDYDELREVGEFHPAVITSRTQTEQAASLTERGWERPAAGEMVLVAIGGDGQQLGTKRLATANVDDAFREASSFIRQHRPKPRDANEMLTAALDEAQRSNRRVWVIEGGSRCGPCFRLARWLDDHRQVLEHDYIFIKFDEVRDANADKVRSRIGNDERAGIPNHAILNADGKVLVTSSGPLGNIGLPSGFEGLRHFRRMLQDTARTLSPTEIDELIRSRTADE